MRRLLLLVALFAAAVLLLRRLAGQFTAPASRRAADAGARGKASSELVRDRVCNTFLPRDRALRLDVSGQTHFFCSESCRARFLEGARGRPDTGKLAS